MITTLLYDYYSMTLLYHFPLRSHFYDYPNYILFVHTAESLDEDCAMIAYIVSLYLI